MKYRFFSCALWLWCLAVISATAGQKTWQPLPPLAFDGPVQNVAASDNGILYIGIGDYVYKSTDNGTTWAIIGEDRIWGGITDVATFPGKPNVVIVSTSTGIYWSMNGGNTWNWDRFEVNPHTGLGGGAGNVYPLVETDRIFAGTYIMSLNGGWQRTHPEKYTYYYAFLSGGTVLTLTGNNQAGEVMSSDNGGTAWAHRAALPGIGPMFVDANGKVYAFTETYTITDGKVIREYPVFVSDDRGANWADFTVGTTGLPAQDSRVQILSIDPATNNVYATVYDSKSYNGEGIYISTDGMKTWKLLDTALAHASPYEMVILKDGSVVFATETHGIISYNATRQPAVQSLNGGLVSTDRLNLFTASTGRLFATGGANGKMKYTDDDGASWNTAMFGELKPQMRAITELPNGDLLLGSIGVVQSGTSPLYRSTDHGATWQPFGSGLINDSANWTGIGSFFIDNSGKLYALTESAGMINPSSLLFSTDNGATWQAIDSIFGSTAVLPTGAIFTAGMNEMFDMFFRRSDDGGKTWTNVVAPRELSITSPPQLSTDPRGNLYFRQHSADTLFVSSDNGITWKAFDGEGYSQTYFDAAGNTYFVYTMANVYLMEKGSTEKTRIITGLPFNGDAVVVFSMAFGTGDTPYISHSNGRIYKLTEAISTDVSSEPATELGATAAYPNPFAEHFTISYALLSASDVTLRIFDILGNEVRTVVAAHQGIGNNTLVIDGSSLVPGLYTYRITAGTLVQSGTVVRK